MGCSRISRRWWRNGCGGAANSMGFGPGRSADTSGGWINHYRRMRRWEDRSLKALRELPSVEFHDAIDFSLAYFLWAHSLREWLFNDGVFTQDVLDNELSKFKIWKLCRDVANRTRHLDLKRNPTDKDWSAYREYDHFSQMLEGRERHIANILFDGEKLPITEVIRQTSAMWEKILARPLSPFLRGEG
jgi:hypothetical protein